MALTILDFISSEGGSFGGRPNGLQYEWISKSSSIILVQVVEHHTDSLTHHLTFLLGFLDK